jgi:hypothetical protein
MLVAVTFWLPDDELVLVGRYNEPHEQMNAVEAVHRIMTAEQPFGYEVILDRSVHPREVRAIRTAPCTVGWRYYPSAHGRRACLCDWCSRGDIKRQRHLRYQERLARRTTASAETVNN